MKLPRFVPDDISKDPEPFIPGPYSMRRKRVKLRTPEAVARRRKYKANKPKKSRICCEHCGKRHTPKRSTRQFCSDSCRVASHIQEYRVFNKLGLIDEWEALDDENKASHKRISFLRHRLYQVIMKI